MGLLEIVFVLLLILKLVGAISITWFWVFFPLILSVEVYIVLFSIFGITFTGLVKLGRHILKNP